MRLDKKTEMCKIDLNISHVNLIFLFISFSFLILLLNKKFLFNHLYYILNKKKWLLNHELSYTRKYFLKHLLNS